MRPIRIIGFLAMLSAAVGRAGPPAAPGQNGTAAASPSSISTIAAAALNSSSYTSGAPLSPLPSSSVAKEAPSSVRGRLSTKTPYDARVRYDNAPSLYDLPDPPGTEPVFVWLLSRHGSRWPTGDRADQMRALAPLLQMVDRRRHPWAANATAPPPYTAGELHPQGEDEMASLARRLRARYPGLLARRYWPRRYPIVSTQVARAAQSASAFALGFFERGGGGGNGACAAGAAAQRGRCGPQPVALLQLPKKQDPVLRFFSMCPTYKAHEKATNGWLAPWLAEQWASLLPGVEARLGLPRGVTAPCAVDALWQLCGYQAGLQGSAGGGNACSAFSASDVAVLEWLEDVQLYETQGPGAAVNYDIAGVLLGDLTASLRAASEAGSGNGAVGGGREKGRAQQLVRLQFAHCETLTPLLTLLGIARGEEGAGGRAVGKARESAFVAAASGPAPVASSGNSTSHTRGPAAIGCKPPKHAAAAPPPPRPPGWAPAARVGAAADAARAWRGGRVAPLGANLVVVLYRDKARPGRYLVRFAHNEQVVRPALCGGSGGDSGDCDLGEFLAAAAKRSVDVPGLLAMCDASAGGGSSSSSSSSKLGSRVDASSSSSSSLEDEDGGGGGGWETADGLPLA